MKFYVPNLNMLEFYLVLFIDPAPSQSDFLNPFQEVLELANAENKETLITGDFNFNFLDASSSSSTKDMKRILSSFNSKQVINKATRITKDSSILLDFFATNIPKNVTLAKVIPSTLSDHGMLVVVRKIMLVNFLQAPLNAEIFEIMTK